jgi:hypothetical protein
MNRTLLAAAGLAVVGIILLVLGNVEFSRQAEVLKLGGFSASATTKRTIPALRYAGMGFLGAGVVVLILGVAGKRR